MPWRHHSLAEGTSANPYTTLIELDAQTPLFVVHENGKLPADDRQMFDLMEKISCVSE